MHACKEFILPCNSEGGGIKWKISGDKEVINIGDLELLEPKIEIDLKESFSFNLFEHIFPCIKGHVKLINAYLSDQQTIYYNTAKTSKIFVLIKMLTIQIFL